MATPADAAAAAQRNTAALFTMGRQTGRPNDLQGGQAQKASQSPAKLRGGDAFMEMLNQQQLAGQAQNQAMIDAWTKAQQRRPMIRRTMGGEVIDQSPVKQPQGMDFFKQNNPFTEESLQRARNVNAQNRYQSQLGAFEGGQAVDQLKKQQMESGVRNPDGSTNFMSNIPSKTVNGQKFVFDQKGQVVGMTGNSGAGPQDLEGPPTKAQISGQAFWPGKSGLQSKGMPTALTGDEQAQNRMGIKNSFLSALSQEKAVPQGEVSVGPVQEVTDRTIKASYQPPVPKRYQLPGVTPPVMPSESSTAFNPAASAGVPSVSFEDLGRFLNVNDPYAWSNDPLGFARRKKAAREKAKQQ